MNIDVNTLDAELNQMVLTGQVMEAFERFYSDDVEMQENGGEPCRGKDHNRRREEEFLASVEQFNGAEVRSTAVTDSVSFGEWMMDITFKGGRRSKIEQVAVRTWRDGRVIRERFYYKG